jgi:hypothetical protein
LLPRSAVTKFATAPGVTRIFDSGSIIVYDLNGSPPKAYPNSEPGAAR